MHLFYLHNDVKQKQKIKSYNISGFLSCIGDQILKKSNLNIHLLE